MTSAKIRIPDSRELRAQLDQEYEHASQVQLCRYALMLASRILRLPGVAERFHDTGGFDIIGQGFRANELWQEGKARVHDVRQAGLRIHRMAKAFGDETVCAVLRCAGHAAATAHMREHAMVASDYAVRVISLLHPGSMEAVRGERLRQIRSLKEIKREARSVPDGGGTDPEGDAGGDSHLFLTPEENPDTKDAGHPEIT